MFKLKPISFFILMAMATHAHAIGPGTVSIVSNGTNVTWDPAANPAINFTANYVTTISTSVITGAITANSAGFGNLDLNGTITINGNIGSGAEPLGYFSTGLDDGFTSRLLDSNVYTFNGNVNVYNFVINNGSAGLPYTSTVVLGGTMSAPNSLSWKAPNAGKVSTLDLQGNSLTTNRVMFQTGAGGALHLVSTITADGGQTSCVAGSNKAGCISAATNGMMGNNLPNNLQVQMRVANGVTLTNGTKYTLVDFAAGQPAVPTLSGAITSLTTGFSFAQDMTNTQDLVIMLTGIPASITIPFFQPNAGSVASNAAQILDGLSATATDPGMISAITALQGMNQTSQNTALRRVAPETNRASVMAATQTMSGALDSVAVRLEGVRTQGFTVGMVDDLMKGKLKLASNGDLSGLVDASASKRRGSWVKAFGSRGDQNLQDSYAGYNSNTWGMTVGTDALLDNDWVVGGAFTYATTDVNMQDFRNGDGTEIKTYQVTGYGSRNFGKWYLEGMLAYAKQEYASLRDTTVSGVARGNFDGNQVAARINAGWPIAMHDKVVFTPVAGLEWNHLNQDNYTETGAGALSLAVQGQSADRVRSLLGAKLSTEIELSSGMKLLPSVNAAWRHDFKNNGLDTAATFTGGGATFTTPGQTLARNSYSLGVALAIRKSSDFTLFMTLDGEKASGYNAVAGQIVGQWRF